MGCKLNNKYKDVFYNKTFLETYLGTLTSVVVLNDEYIFSRNTDVLFIDDANIPNFKLYNYIKIEDTIGTFYAFINSIQWVNDTYQIYYEEDIMSNWFEYVHIRNSLLTGCKSLKLYKGTAQKNITYYKYPIESESNDALIVKSHTNNYNYADPNYKIAEICIVIKLQLYTLTQQGQQNSRIPLLILCYKDINNTRDYNFFQSIDDFISVIIDASASSTITYNNVAYNYDIDKIYAVPKEFIPVSKFYYATGFNLPLSYCYFNILKVDNEDGLANIYTETINYDRKIQYIGLFTQPISVVKNGTNTKVTVNTYCCGYGFSIFINIQNKIIEITDYFEIDLPYSQLTASELQIKRLQLNLAENELKNKIETINIDQYKTSISGILGLNQGMYNANANIIGGGSGGITGMISGVYRGLASASNAVESFSNGLWDLYSNRVNIKFAEERIGLLNRKIYSSSAVVNNKFSYINAIYGITVFSIDEDNTSQIEQAVKLSGYVVRELVGDIIQELDTSNLADDYEVLKFDEVNLYGVISQEYIRIIEQILLAGVRIWCKGDIGDII